LRDKITYFSGLALSILFLVSCGSQRKNVVSKGYHNTTSLFNWLYNGELAWQEGVNSINAGFKVPSEGFIPVIYFGTPEDAKTAEGSFDKAIEKSEVVLIKHPNSRYIRNARFLIGRSLFYKSSYFLAIQNLEWVINEHPKAPIVPDCHIWLARTYYFNDRPTTAQKMIDEKIKKYDLNNRQKGELALLQVTIEMDNEQYDNATKILERSIRIQKGRLNRARVNFLLGQLYMKQGKMARAFVHFKTVTRINTDYELIFNAKLLAIRLSSHDVQEGVDPEARMRRMLNRMLRDEKNLDYKDQIHYEIALIDFGKGEFASALTSLQKSVNTSTKNIRQKALSHYKAGQIYFYNLKEFTLAQAKFDSASTLISKNDPEYKEIVTVGKTLKEYVNLVNTIHYQDSMIWLAGMSHNQLAKQIDLVIAEEKRREDEAKIKQQISMIEESDPGFNNQFNTQNNQQSAGSGFYFNNMEQVSSGRIEFQAKWGDRKNEDDWRRKFKALQLSNLEEKEEEKENIDSNLVATYGNKAKYYKDVPTSAEEIEAAHAKVRAALFSLGQLFDKKLELPDSAIATFEKLVARYPASDDALKARFALYNLYSKVDPYKADEQKSYICGKNPHSIYCKLIKGENVEAELNEHLKKYETAYAALWPTYQKKDYETVISFANFIVDRFPDNPDIARVKYIKGLSYGETGNLDSLKSVFSSISSNYPDHEVTPIVIKTLSKLGMVSDDEGSSKIEEKKKAIDASSNTKYAGFEAAIKPSEKLFVVMLIRKDAISNNQLKTKLTDFNNAKFNSNNLTASIFFYKDERHLGYISQFNSVKEAMMYIDFAQKDPGLSPLLSNEGDMIVFVTPGNFKVAYQQKRFEDYNEFYQEVILPSVE